MSVARAKDEKVSSGEDGKKGASGAGQENEGMNNEHRRARDIELLTLLIERALDGNACDASILGADCVHVMTSPTDDRRLNLEVRFNIMQGMPAVVTDWGWRHDRDDAADHCRRAKEIASSIGLLWRERKEIKVAVAHVTTAVRREIARAKRRHIQYRLVSAAICPVEAGNTKFPYVHVRLERLSASLLPEIVQLEVDDAAQVKESFANMLESQEVRRARQIILQDAGADGEIDAVALRIMQLNGCDVPAILASLPHAECEILDVDLPETAGRPMVLFWKDGIVHANVGLSETVQWSEGRVSFKEVPKRFPARPHGRLLSDFVKHEALPGHLQIHSGYRSGTSASAGVLVPMARFNSATGQAWRV